MDEIKLDYIDQMAEHRLVGHVCPVSKPKLPTSADLKKLDGPVRKEVLPNLPTMSSRIKFAMRGKTQAEFAKELGTNTCTVSTWCQGKYEPRRDVLERISKTGNVPMSWLLGEWGAEPVAACEPKAPSEHKTETNVIPFFMTINGVYSGENIGALLSGLIKDREYTVRLELKESG